MKKLLLVLLFLSASGVAQNTTISSTMTDSDGIAWASGTWRIDFRPNNNQPNESAYRLLNGQPLSSAVTHQNGSLDTSGHFSISVYDSTLIVPTGSGWTLTLCPLASAPCGVYQFTTAGSSMDISSNLTTAIPAPRFPPNAGAFGYADVEVQTSLNQGASYWNVTTQTQHIWNGQTWVVGGGAGLPPGVTGDGNNGLLVQGAVSASSLPGYRQNPYFARSRDRDGVLQITVTPQDFPGCAESGMGNIDDRPCFTQAMQYLSTALVNEKVIKKLIVPYTRDGYTFRSPGAMVQLPFDFGDYHGAASYASAAAVAPQFVNGALVGCTTSGGAGYAPNAHLPVFIQDLSLQGSGAYATVATDVNGTPGAICEAGSIIPGMNYPPTGVTAALVPLGGDGAAGTCNLGGTTSGQFQPTCTLTQIGSIPIGGSGYQSGGLVAKMAGLSCGTYPTLTVTVANAAVTGVTSTAGATCTYTGSSGPVNVPIQFGASCGGTQCTLMSPETPVYQACAVSLVSGVTIEGVGNPTIATTWDGGTANPSQMIAFCDATGSQSNYITVKNLTIGNAFIGFYFPFEVQGLTLDSVGYGRVALEGYAYSIAGNYYYAVGARVDNSPLPAPPSRFTNIRSNAAAGWFCGGAWAGRNISYAGTNQGGGGAGVWLYLYNDYGGYFWSGTTNTLGHSGASGNQFGRCFNLVVDGYTKYTGPTMLPPAQAVFDKYFEAQIWKSQNGPAVQAPAFGTLSNGLASCVLLTGLTMVDRTVDYNWGYKANGVYGGSYSTYPYSMCYPGVSNTSFLFLPRYSQADLAQVTGPNTNIFNNIFVVNGWRPIISGRFDALTVNRIMNVYGGGFTSDPYVQSGQIVGMINAGNELSVGVQGRVEDGVLTSNANTAGVTNTPIQFTYYGTPNNNGLYVRNVNTMTPTPLITYAAVSASLGGSALTVNQCISNTTTITGITTTMVARSNPTTYPGDGYNWQSYISAANTVTTKLCAIAAGTPVASTYQIRVTQ